MMRNIVKIAAGLFALALMFTPSQEASAAFTCGTYRYCVNDCAGCVDLCLQPVMDPCNDPICEPGGFYCPGETACRCGYIS